jgi:hypothetical protein
MFVSAKEGLRFRNEHPVLSAHDYNWFSFPGPAASWLPAAELELRATNSFACRSKRGRKIHPLATLTRLQPLGGEVRFSGKPLAT